MYITLHAIQRAEQRGLPRPTAFKARLAKLFGRKFGQRNHWLYAGHVWAFSKDAQTLVTVYPHK